MLCTDLTLVKRESGALHVEPIRCKRWSCEHCQPHRRRQLVAKGASGHPTTFITLTSSDATADTPAEAARVLVSAWRKVRREAMRRYGLKHLPFLAVFEATKTGRPHLHILARVKWIDQKWLSDRMRVHARAPIVDIRRVGRMQDVVRYLFKYIGKQPHQFGTSKRYWSSQDYEQRDPEDDRLERRARTEWWVKYKDFWSYIAQAHDVGFDVELRGEEAWLRWPTRGPPP